MYKKIALAVSAALLAGSAMAADVTLYGVVDTGFSYTNTRSKVSATIGDVSAGFTTSTKEFSMDSGNTAGSRWGLKGSEDLGNGYKVSFKLESGFSSDTGKGSDDGLFNRESSISVSGPFGAVYAGRMGSLISDLGSVGWYGAMASPFGSGWGGIAGHEAVMSMHGRMNNTLVYMSPRFSGLQFSGQYSMGEDGKENKPTTDRYAAIGVNYQVGNLEIGGLVDYTNVNSSKVSDEVIEAFDASYKFKDTWTVNLAANYDFGFMKVYGAAQYFKNAHDINGVLSNKTGSAADRAENIPVVASLEGAYDDADVAAQVAYAIRTVNLTGYGVNIGASAPVPFGGDFMISAGYADGDVKASVSVGDYSIGKFAGLKAYTVLAGYEYPFSKRTKVYVGAGWTKYELKSKGDLAKIANAKVQTQTFQAMTGLVHKF